MKWKTTLILLLIVVILSALVYFFDGRKSDDKYSTISKSQIKLTLPSERINKVEIIYGNNAAVSLTKGENNTWKSSPLRMESSEIDLFVARISKKFIFFKVTDPGSLDEYGLETPRITVNFHLDNGTSKMIKIGNEIPTGNYVYMSVDEMPNDVFYTTSSIINDFSEFAKKQIENNEGT